MKNEWASERGASVVEYVSILAILVVMLVVVFALINISTQSRLQKAAGAVEKNVPCGAALSGAECN